MFKKALAHQSNATPIRSSARRQLLQSIHEQYPALKGGCVAEGENGVTEKELGKLLLPDSVRSATFETSGGVEGVSSSGLFCELTDQTVYSSPSGDPLWLSFGRGSKELIPTRRLGVWASS
jgi:translation initiation factor 2D